MKSLTTMTIKPDDLNIFYVVHRTVYYKSYKHTFLAIFKTAYWFDCIYLKNLSLSNCVYNLILSGPVYLSIQTDFKTVGTDQRKKWRWQTHFSLMGGRTSIRTTRTIPRPCQGTPAHRKCSGTIDTSTPHPRLVNLIVSYSHD